MFLNHYLFAIIFIVNFFRIKSYSGYYS